MKVFKESWFSVIYVLFLWLILTGININKAYHIDDTFHLEAAECIGQHPLKPMSGLINWEDIPTPMYEHNQPPLFFYLIYVHQLLFGNSEISLHLLLSVFTLLALLFFLKLTKLLNVKSPITLLTIFAFCPAFAVNQNLMIDVPVLALSLGIMYYLLKGQRSDDVRYYLLSVVLLTVGLLIKYSMIPVFFVILIVITASKSPGKSVVLFIPLIALALWSVWNFIEFGSTHLFSRPTSGFDIEKIIAFGSTLGAISTFTVIYVYGVIPKKITRFLIMFILALFLLFVPTVYSGLIEESRFNGLLNYIFLINGFVLIALIVRQAINALFKQKGNYFRTPDFVIITYIAGVGSFIALFAPFNATRHVLLLIPFILLFGHKYFEMTRGVINKSVVTVSILLSVLLGVSDWVYADFYRKHVDQINVSDARVWSLGHWGWQWYSKKAGMLFYSKNNEFEVRNGDVVVFPKDISRQHFSADIQLDTVRFITEAPTFFTFLSGKNFASMYNSFVKKPAWSLSSAPIDTIFICEVKQELGIDEVAKRIRLNESWMSDIKNKSIKRNLPVDSMIILDAKWVLEQERKE